jgi:hypothetical protein
MKIYLDLLISIPNISKPKKIFFTLNSNFFKNAKKIFSLKFHQGKINKKKNNQIKIKKNKSIKN